MSIDSEVLLRNHYTKVYAGSGSDKSDSPERARDSLLKALAEEIDESQPCVIFDDGGGRQVLARQLRSRGLIDEKAKVITLDSATIDRDKLLERNNPQVEQVQGNGRHLPIRERSVDYVVSSMAADMMGPGAFEEIHRVLKPERPALFTLHHPSQIPKDVDQRVRDPSLTDRQRRVFTYQKYQKDEDVLFKSEAEIRETLGEAGLKVEEVRLENDRNGRQWWFVRSRK